MTDADVLDAIRRIIRSRPRLARADQQSADARDLAKYDRIVGLIQRRSIAAPTAANNTPPAADDLLTRLDGDGLRRDGLDRD